MRAKRTTIFWIIPLILLACGTPHPRSPLFVEAIETGADRYVAERRAWRRKEALRIVERMEAIARGETADSTFDALLFSGGAEWGAFGAGYATEWKRLGEDAEIPMPEFDLVSGISTGALMAAYVASGELERYRQLENFYRNVSPDWVESQFMSALLFRDTTSLADNSRIREVVEAAVDDNLIDDLKVAHEERKSIYVGTVNLDFLSHEYWNLAAEAAHYDTPHSRIVDILMAATAIPVVFPPVEIDGMLYADLGGGEMVPVFRSDSTDRFVGIWRARNGDKKPPLFRIWIIYNVPLGYDPDAVEMSLVPLALRGWDTVIQASAFKPLMALKLMERLSREHETPRLEVRWIAIPSSWRYDPDDPPFDPVIANRLADLGRGMVREPGGAWRTDLPQ